MGHVDVQGLLHGRHQGCKVDDMSRGGAAPGCVYPGLQCPRVAHLVYGSYYGKQQVMRGEGVGRGGGERDEVMREGCSEEACRLGETWEGSRSVMGGEIRDAEG